MSANPRGGFVNHYDVLGVEEYASTDEIKSAYRKLCLSCHPDKIRGSKEVKDDAHWKFVQIRTAYDTLKEAATRQVFDAELGFHRMNLNHNHGHSNYYPPQPSSPRAPRSRSTRRSRRRSCPDCGDHHVTQPEPAEIKRWVRHNLRPERLASAVDDLRDLASRLGEMASWFARRQRWATGARDALRELVGRADDEAERVSVVLLNVQTLSYSCAPQSRREELLREVSRMARACRHSLEAEMTVGRYWEVLKGASPEEWDILYDTFLNLLERWLNGL
ncbi:hypothetical protein QBC33DRAFT_178736 [Phialemonium atrogriseum]|uniref:J domain-containing protein n=1 Tax=Phialemonium atrogriseum TaxID=1093897 RepID=A0AAJ0FLC6_9PEZI|nr:uncharacterized protein QBC33DRAFT_178736 [Phialemonium atrogriseum]KAK1764970.1 hypothetical protein QBC33DRAFT_178736 [Phialemonium atrogriseum]